MRHPNGKRRFDASFHRQARVFVLAVGSALLMSTGFAQAAEAKCGGAPKVCLYDGIYAGYNVAYTCSKLSTRAYPRAAYDYETFTLPRNFLWKTTSVINRCPFNIDLHDHVRNATVRVFAREWAVLGDYRRFDGRTTIFGRSDN